MLTMKPLSVMELKAVIAGELTQGHDDMIIEQGAYRIKQVKKKNTVLFSKIKILNWNDLKEFFPLVLVTSQELTERDQIDQLSVIQVKDVDVAYWEFINYYRDLFEIPVIAVTGTSGKTTTKEMIKHILSKSKSTVSTDSTNNSRTAHLHYLLSIDDNTEAAVFETAVGAPGDVLIAGKVFKPTIGMITNIGAHHLNYCKTIEAYISAKGEMLQALNNKGVLIINSNDENSKKIELGEYNGRVIRVGMDSYCDYYAKDIKYINNGMQFVLRHKRKKYKTFVPGLGRHQVYNALMAIVAAHEVGISLKKARKHLKTFQTFNKQLQVFTGINNSIILDDTWSITTTSLEAALNVLKDVGKGKKTIAIIGTITDLGSWGYIVHKQAGVLIYEIGVDVLITIGEHARIMAEQALACGMTSSVYSFNNSILANKLLKKIVNENTIILIKGDMYSQAIVDLAYSLRKEK